MCCIKQNLVAESIWTCTTHAMWILKTHTEFRTKLLIAYPESSSRLCWLWGRKFVLCNLNDFYASSDWLSVEVGMARGALLQHIYSRSPPGPIFVEQHCFKEHQYSSPLIQLSCFRRLLRSRKRNTDAGTMSFCLSVTKYEQLSRL